MGELEKILRIFTSRDMDAVSVSELIHYAELKIAEHEKFRGQIAHDLARLGENAWCDPKAYAKLKVKYRVAHAGKKKLAILDIIKAENCK